ncbi:hypothetical protein [Bradyrhizobium sp. AZCC 1721]|uniref:hypothetical protein n=1 Tax=Bradyrhizobium sp. AZCC 1721 TaxID=3117016 RepID=UPI002FF3B64B
MSERCVHLIGADAVRSAGHAMRSAADRMQSAAANMERAFESHQRFLEDWLSRFEQIMERKNG